MAKEIGMDVEDHIKDIDISEKELIDLINQLNNNDKVNGILVQLPSLVIIYTKKLLLMQ